MRSGLIFHWIKMLRIVDGDRGPAELQRYRSSAGSTINTSGFRVFDRHTVSALAIHEPRSSLRRSLSCVRLEELDPSQGVGVGDADMLAWNAAIDPAHPLLPDIVQLVEYGFTAVSTW
jgi:hypothetical protein